MEHKYTTRPCSITGYCLLVDAKTNGSELSLQMPQERALFIVKACNNHDTLKAKAALHDELVDGLETAVGMLKHIGCTNANCSGGSIQVSDDEWEQCQWCYEAGSIALLLAKAKAVK